MAWLGKFDDFDQFDDTFDGKSTFKQNHSNFYGKGQFDQQPPKAPADVKKLCEITPQTAFAVRIFFPFIAVCLCSFRFIYFEFC